MSADNTLEILIQTKADLAAAKAVQAVLEKQILNAKFLGKSYNDQQAQLDKLSDAVNSYVAKNGDASGSVEHLKFNHRALHKIMHEIGAVTAPELGQALTGALYGPLGPAIAIGAAIEFLAKEIGESSKKTEELEDKMSALGNATWAAVTEANNAATEAASKYLDELKKISTLHETIATQEQRQLAILNAKLGAQKEILKAQENAELAAAKGNKVAEEEIKRRYAAFGSGGDLAGEASQLNTLKIQKYQRGNAVEGLQSKADADQKAFRSISTDEGALSDAVKLKQLQDAQAGLDQKAGRYNLAELKKQEESARALLPFATDKAQAQSIVERAHQLSEAGEAAIKAAEDNKAKTAELNAKVVAHTIAVERAKNAAELSEKALRENAEAIKALTDKITTDSAILDIHKATAKSVAEISAPGSIEGSALLAERGNASSILAGHADAVGADAQQIIVDLGTLMAGHAVTLKQAAAMVVRADQTKDSLQAAVAAMDKTSEAMTRAAGAAVEKLNKIQTRLDDLANQIRDIHNK